MLQFLISISVMNDPLFFSSDVPKQLMKRCHLRIGSLDSYIQLDIIYCTCKETAMCKNTHPAVLLVGFKLCYGELCAEVNESNSGATKQIKLSSQTENCYPCYLS